MKKPNKDWFAAEPADVGRNKRAKGKKHLERSRRDRLTDAVRNMGGQLRKVQFIGHKGAPDHLILVSSGYHCLVELKQDDKEPEELQKIEHEILRKAGVDVFVVNSDATLESLIKRLREIDNA